MPTLSETDALDLLRQGRLEPEGRLVEASNTTLRAFITLDGLSARCVYKPVRGERPLIQKDVTTTTKFLSGEEIRNQPLRGYQDAVAQQSPSGRVGLEDLPGVDVDEEDPARKSYAGTRL